MRIGLNFTPPHESPEQWAEILEDCGFRGASLFFQKAEKGEDTVRLSA